jgi:hypothetical protein
MNEFWTKEKLGKHPTIAETAKQLYSSYAMCSPEKLLARLKESIYKFGDTKPVEFNNILMFANLDDCLKPEYVNAALKVTTARPSIGRGEFLLASLFANIGFAKHKGDLIDLQTKKMAEVKGIDATINGELTLNQKLLDNVYHHFRLTPPAVLNQNTVNALQRVCRTPDDVYYVLEAFRNTNVPDVALLRDTTDLCKQTKSLFVALVAMHLYKYLKNEHASYLIAVNNKEFKCFNAPMFLSQAVTILNDFSINEWRIGETGFKITLK